MKDLLKSFLGIMLITAIAFFLGTRYGRKAAKNGPGTQVVRDTVELVKYDTIVREKPVFRYSYVHDTVRTYFTTIQHDSVLVEVPIESRTYAEDSLYYITISGWKPSLDTLILWPKETVITVTNTILPKPAKWSFGLTAGPSVLATPKGEVHAGLGVSAGLTYRF